MSTVAPERRTAMYHAQLAMGAVMADADGWKLPAHYGDASREAGWLRHTVGVSDVSPIGKVRIVGEDAAQVVALLAPQATAQSVGAVVEADSYLQRGGKVLSVRLAVEEFLLLTPAGEAPEAVEAMKAAVPPCAHVVDVTSGLCGLAIVGPATRDLMSRATELDVSPGTLTDLACVQSRFAEIQALLLRRDVSGIAMYQLYAAREFGEYLWEVSVETAGEVGGGAVGTEALLGLRNSD